MTATLTRRILTALALVFFVGTVAADDASDRRDFDSIKSDYEAWKKDKRDWAKFYVGHIGKIRLAMCDGDDLQLEDRTNRVAEDAKSALEPVRRALRDRLGGLITRVEKVESNNALQSDARRVKSNLQAARRRLENLDNAGILRGSNNPKLRTRLEVGKSKHRSLQSSLSCTKAEFRVSSGFVDCLKVSGGSSSSQATCSIIEVKPNNDAAVRAGWDQVNRYKREILDVVKSESFSSDNALLKPCVDPKSKEIMLEMKVVTYEFCPIPPEEIDVEPEEDRDS